MRALLSSADTKAGSFIRFILREDGFAVDCVPLGPPTLQHVAHVLYDLIICDPLDQEVIAAVGRISHKCNTALLAVAQAGESPWTLHARFPELDECVARPGGDGELLARIRNALRRAHVCTEIDVGSLHIDRWKRQVTVERAIISLTEREYEVVEYLARYGGEVVTRPELSMNACGPSAGVDNVSVYVHRARQKLAAHGVQIQTERGLGYRLMA